MNILGFVIDEHSIRPNDECVTGIVEAAVPAKKQQLRSFLGPAAFYAKFVPSFSAKVNTTREMQNAEPFLLDLKMPNARCATSNPIS